MENQEEDIDIVEYLGLPKGSIFVFDVMSIPDNMSVDEYIKYIKATKTIPWQSYTDTFLRAEGKPIIRATEKPYILVKEDNEEIEKIGIKIVEFKKDS